MNAANRLDGRSCLIVGGTGGIGLATASRFLAEGARVVVSGRTGDEVRAARGHLAPLGPAWAEEAETSDGDAVSSLFDRAIDRLGGRLDVLVHVAGISGRRYGDGPLHECSEAGWDAVMGVNARGVFLTNREAARRMLAQGPDEVGLRGTVLNLGSVTAWSFSPEFFGTYAYAASKAAVHAMTLQAASRYAADRIRFNAVAPALVETPMSARACQDPAIRAYLATKQPIAGAPGTPDDVAEAILYLCEPASRFVTGVVLAVDGGWCVSEGQHPSDDGTDG
ncbi:SDR family NAD(P)-dependent oxidoreductase [Tautonia plasticadhaerens]|uniref:Glucose 1-dehydrogenase B n=1 Tax=Tautonia plasticadhaerens TaxID=2527974 RepID=A0A518H2W4_9BACT|nr:SDR family oxidoreductase [Tautonia plasticadhaerens]QDV35173.1 Glucose 1-dehydrogenase B [Tautonia plasticadhaerens]